MDKESIMERLEMVFRDVFADDTIVLSEETNASSIEGWDSLMHISILAAVQDEFQIDFDMDEIISMKNVGDMLQAILKKTEE